MFRYKLGVVPVFPHLSEQAKDPGLYTSEAIEAFLQRANGCNMFLELQDGDGFLLRNLPITFVYGTNADARIRGLSANSAAQMDAGEYKKLLGDSQSLGGWDITWSCSS